MRRFRNISICLILAVTVLLTGCAAGGKKELKLEVKEVQLLTTDENKIFDTDKLYEHDEYRQYERENMESAREIKVDGEIFKTEYKYSSSDPFENYDIDTYEDAEGGITVQLRQDNGQIVGYRNAGSGSNLENISFSSKEELLKSVEGYVSEKINVDVFTPIVNTQVVSKEGGEITSRSEDGFYLPQSNEEAYYTVSYTYMVGNIKTMEIFELNIVNNSVESYFYTMPEAFSKSNNNFEISEESAKKSVEKFIVDSISEDCTNVSFDVVDTFLTIDEKGDYILITIVSMEYDYCGTSDESMEMMIVKLEDE